MADDDSDDDQHPTTSRTSGSAGFAAIVLCGIDPEALGVAAAAIRARGRRAAIWLGEPDADGIIEMVDELFGPGGIDRVK